MKNPVLQREKSLIEGYIPLREMGITPPPQDRVMDVFNINFD